MKHAAEPEIPGGLSIFEKSCAYCGARFRVLASPSAPLHAEDYECPECGKRYPLEPGTGEHEVQLLAPRRDGKLDRYQETMF